MSRHSYVLINIHKHGCGAKILRLFIKQNRLDALISQIYFWNKTLHVSDTSPVRHQEFFTVHIGMVYVSKHVWDIILLCVPWKTPDDGKRNCPKHVEFYSKNKFETLVLIAGSIIWIYHDARSPEPQNSEVMSVNIHVKQSWVIFRESGPNQETAFKFSYSV